MSSLRAWYDLIRFHEYGPFFILCGVVGALLAAVRPDLKLLALIVFIVVFSASGFVVNDLVDVDEDRAKQHVRNPVASGRLSWRSASVAFATLSLTSVASLALLTRSAVPAGIIAVTLLWGYSLGPRFKDFPFAGALVQAAVPALYVVMGYLLYRPLSFPILLVAGISFLLATMTGVIQDLRDMSADRNFRRTSVLVLGPTRAVDLSIALMVGAFAMYILLIVEGFLGPPFALFAPLVYFLFEPLVKLRSQSIGADQAISKLRARGVALSILLVAAYLFL